MFSVCEAWQVFCFGFSEGEDDLPRCHCCPWICLCCWRKQSPGSPIQEWWAPPVCCRHRPGIWPWPGLQPTNDNVIHAGIMLHVCHSKRAKPFYPSQHVLSSLISPIIIFCCFEKVAISSDKVECFLYLLRFLVLFGGILWYDILQNNDKCNKVTLSFVPLCENSLDTRLVGTFCNYTLIADRAGWRIANCLLWGRSNSESQTYQKNFRWDRWSGGPHT